MDTQEASEIIGYTFRDEKLLATALTHASSAGHRLESNERLEFLGDAILNYVVCDHLFESYPGLLEGEMTKIKSAVVSRKTCAKISEHTGLSSMLSLGKGMINRPALPGSVAAAVFESVIAAIYLDGGIEPARKFIRQHTAEAIREAAESSHQQNFKSVLQQYAQRHLASNPTYLILDEKGPDHSKCFNVGVEMDNRRHEPAWGNSKKEAEQNAALLALCGLGLAEVNPDGKVTLCEPPAERSAQRADTSPPLTDE